MYRAGRRLPAGPLRAHVRVLAQGRARKARLRRNTPLPPAQEHQLRDHVILARSMPQHLYGHDQLMFDSLPAAEKSGLRTPHRVCCFALMDLKEKNSDAPLDVNVKRRTRLFLAHR